MSDPDIVAPAPAELVGGTRFRLLDASGQPVEVDQAAAQEGLASGALRTAQPLRLRHSSGRIAEIPAEGVARALRAGFALDTPAAAARRAYQREHPVETEVVNPAVTGAASTLRESTLGASELGEEALGVRDEINTLREENPIAATVGDVAGVALPALATGGETALARGALAPGRVALSAGEHAGAAVARGLAPAGASLGRRILARGLGSATEGAVQTGLSEGGHILTEDALGEDPGDVADRLVSSVGLGSVLGFGLGTAGGTVSEALRGGAHAAQGARDALRRAYVQRTGRELEGGVAEMLSDQYARAAGALRGGSGGDIRRFVDLGAEGREARRIVERGDAVYEDGARRMTHALDRVGLAMHHVTGEIVGGMKVSSIERVIDGSQLAQQLAESATMLGRARALSDQIDAEVRAYGAASQFGGRGGAAHATLRGAVNRAEDALERIARSGESESRRAAETFAAMDELRRQMGRAQVVVGRGTTGPVHEAYYQLRELLERGELWGDGAAALQRETNAPWHRFLTTAGDFDRTLMRDGAAVGFDRVTAGDSARVASYVRSLGSAANESREQIVRDTLAALGDLNEAARAHHALTPEGAAQARELRSALAELQAVHGDVSREASVLNQWREIGGHSTSLGSVLQGAGATAAALGGLPLGAALAAAGTAANALTNPQAIAMRIGAIQRAIGSVDSRIAQSVRSFLARGSRGARVAAERVRAVGSRTIRGGTYGGAAAYRRRVRQLTVHQDATMLTDAIATSTRDMHDTPNIRAAVQRTGARAHSFLVSQIPRAPQPPGQLRVTPSDPSLADQERFMRVARAVDDPLSILADLRSGAITPEAVAAVRTVYPQLYQRIVSEVTRELVASGRTPSYQDRIRLGMLLGRPTDPSLAPESIAVLQQAHALAAAEAQQHARRPAPDLSAGYASRTDAIEGRRIA